MISMLIRSWILKQMHCTRRRLDEITGTTEDCRSHFRSEVLNVPATGGVAVASSCTGRFVVPVAPAGTTPDAGFTAISSFPVLGLKLRSPP